MLHPGQKKKKIISEKGVIISTADRETKREVMGGIKQSQRMNSQPLIIYDGGFSGF
jgi:hypothetical protein